MSGNFKLLIAMSAVIFLVNLVIEELGAAILSTILFMIVYTPILMLYSRVTNKEFYNDGNRSQGNT